jgi:hypothetical protein
LFAPSHFLIFSDLRQIILVGTAQGCSKRLSFPADKANRLNPMQMAPQRIRLCAVCPRRFDEINSSMDHVQAGELNGFWYPARFIAQFAPRRDGKRQADGHGQNFFAGCVRKKHLILSLHSAYLVRAAQRTSRGITVTASISSIAGGGIMGLAW